MEKEKIELKKVIELLPKRVSLTYVDYNDSLDGREETLAKCIRNNNFDSLYEEIDECFWEQEWESVCEVKRQLIDDIQQEFEIDEEDAVEFFDEHDAELQDEIYNRNDSTPVKDLLRNMRDLVVFYDTGEEFNGYGNSAAQYRLDRMRIKKLLGITDSTFDHDIEQMMYQASYGGNLVVYFNADINDLINVEKEFKSIQFSDAAIAIIDTGGGSGDHCHIEGHSFTLPFNRNSLFIEKTVHYNYTYEVCGMYSNWCERTGVTLLEEPTDCELSESSLNAFMLQEAKYDETFKKGGCTFGDMRYERHRRHIYRNDFPCGNTCPECNTFWID